MKKTDIAASQPSYEEILRKERRANSAWNKLRRNKTAMIGLFIIVIMTAIAVLDVYKRQLWAFWWPLVVCPKTGCSRPLSRYTYPS